MLRDDALAAWTAGVAAADPAARVATALAARALSPFPARTLVVSVGKAAAGMMRGANEAFAPDTKSIVLLPAGACAGALRPETVALRGGHPHPTQEGFASTRRILAEVDALGEGDRLVFLLSGGASALLEAPAETIPERLLVRAHEQLVASGLPIADINLVRGCLSGVKAGRLAARAHPAAVTTLAISDVQGDDPAAIGSGPTVPLTMPRAQAARLAIEILRKARVALPGIAMAALRREERSKDAAGDHPASVDFLVIASNATAVDAARAELERRGYAPGAPQPYLDGSTADCSALVAAFPGRAAVFGGEPTVAVRSAAPGRGGRSLDLAARLALSIRGQDGVAIVCAGTDGCDGSSRAAGAIVDGGTAARAERCGRPLEAAIAAFDTEPALEASGDLLVTGATGTNVGDLVVAVRA